MLNKLKTRWQARVSNLRSEISYGALSPSLQTTVDDYTLQAEHRQDALQISLESMNASKTGIIGRLFHVGEAINHEVKVVDEPGFISIASLFIKKQLTITAVDAIIDIAIPFIPYAWIPGVNTVYRRILYGIAAFIINRRFGK